MSTKNSTADVTALENTLRLLYEKRARLFETGYTREEMLAVEHELVKYTTLIHQRETGRRIG